MKHKKIIKRLFVFSLLLGFCSIAIFSCKTDGIGEDEFQIQHLRQAQLKQLYTQGILPLSSTFEQNTTELLAAISSFNNETTIEHLIQVQEKWHKAFKTWKQLELYNIGEVALSFIRFEINRWPTNTTAIEENISNPKTINAEFINSIGSSSKGISAIEYLIFGTGNSTANQMVLNSFLTGSGVVNRKAYLEALAVNLNTKSAQLVNLWKNQEAPFLTALESGINGSQNQVTNAMANLIEVVVVNKLGAALGDTTGGTVVPENLEAFRGRASLSGIENNLIALKNCYLGHFNANTISWGYDDYLNLIGKSELSSVVLERFSICEAQLEAVNTSLFNTIQTQPETIQKLKLAFTDLLVAIKVDVASAIGTTITVNDNDGD